MSQNNKIKPVFRDLLAMLLWLPVAFLVPWAWKIGGQWTKEQFTEWIEKIKESN